MPNALIAMSGRLPQLRAPESDANSLAQVMRIGNMADAQRLNRLQIQDAERVSRENALANRLISESVGPDGQIDRNKVTSGFASQGLGSRLPALQKQFADQDKAGADAKKQMLDLVKQRTEIAGQAFGFVLKNPTVENAHGVLDSLASRGVFSPESVANLKTQVNPQNVRQFAEQMFRMALAADKQLATFQTRDAGGTVETLRLDAVDGSVTPVSSIAKTATPGDLLTDQRVRAEGALNRAVTIRGQDKVDARAQESNKIQAGQKTQTAVSDLRKEFNGLTEVKNYKEVLPIIQSVQRAPDTPAGDIDLIYGVGKIMDPNSVVREGEMTIVIKSGSPAQRLQGLVNYVQGGGRLTPQQRQELVEVMNSRVSGLKSNYDAARSTYETHADRLGLPKDQIFIESPQSQVVDLGALPSGGRAAGGKVIDFGSLK